MSAVELAVKKVRKLSAGQARELLGWLEKQQMHKKSGKRRHESWWRKGTARDRKGKLKNWEDSVRGTTDWELPRMPDDLVAVETFRL